MPKTRCRKFLGAEIIFCTAGLDFTRPAQKKAILKTQILQVYPLARADCLLQKRASRARWPIGPLLRRAPLANVFRQALPSAPRMEIGDLAY
jgi:hypothetical protein